MAGGTILYWIIGLAIVGAVGTLIHYARNARSSDDLGDEGADGDDPYLAAQVRACLRGSEGVPHYDIAVPNAGGRGTQDGASLRRGGSLARSHETGSSACPRQ